MLKPLKLPVKEAINGTSLRVGDLQVSAEVRTFLISEINRASGMIAANKSLAGDEEVSLCIDQIFEENHMIKIEEVRIVFDNLISGRYGKFYERFKVAEILEGFRIYGQEERALALEQRSKEYMRKSEEEMNATAKAFEGYKHKPVFAKTLRDKFTNFGADRSKSVSDLKKEILTPEELETLNK